MRRLLLLSLSVLAAATTGQARGHARTDSHQHTTVTLYPGQVALVHVLHVVPADHARYGLPARPSPADVTALAERAIVPVLTPRVNNRPVEGSFTMGAPRIDETGTTIELTLLAPVDQPMRDVQGFRLVEGAGGLPGPHDITFVPSSGCTLQRAHDGLGGEGIQTTLSFPGPAEGRVVLATWTCAPELRAAAPPPKSRARGDGKWLFWGLAAFGLVGLLMLATQTFRIKWRPS